MLRVYFRRDRRLPGKLSQCAAEALKTLFRTAGTDPEAAPGIIIAIQIYGDLVNFHPHLHALVTDGVFTPTGWFVAFPKSTCMPWSTSSATGCSRCSSGNGALMGE